ncbi:MAG: GGDEF domain-containing protein [Bacteroides sp.]|nr:GGDEF domain-containing protein [Bacteroides sp.]
MTDYSSGPKVYAVYISVVIYLILILYYCLRYWNMLDSEKRLSIILAVPIYIASAAVQFFIPEFLVSVICTSLITMGLILSNENTEKYMDEKTGLFNQYSFEIVLDDYDFSKHKNIAGLLCFCRVSNNIDFNQDGQILQDIYKEIKLNRLQGYRVCENGVVFLSGFEERANCVLNRIKENILGKYGKNNVIVETKVITKNEFSDKPGLMRIIIGFCRVTGSRFAFFDYLTHIYNRNALERDMPKADSEKKGYYVIADLNDLKIVNDTVGHSAGDEMLQSFAEILSEAAGSSGRVYRQGGDEFAVLYDQAVEPFLQRLSELCGTHNDLRSVPISYAVGYCRLSEEGFVDTADKMMYENKRKMKGK